MATDIRNAETQNAQNNPSIISNLVGSNPNGAPMTAPPATTPQLPTNAPPEAGAANNIAQGMASNLYGGGYLGQMGANRDAQLAELYNYDKQMETGYNPLPTPEGYVQDPGQLSSALSTAANTMSGAVGASQNASDIAEKAYQTAIGSVLDRFTSFLQMQQNAKIQEQQMQLERDKMQNGSKGIKALTTALLTSGGKMDQNTLLMALSQADPSEIKPMMDLYSQFSQGDQLNDSQAILQAMQYPGADEILKVTSDTNRPQLAREIVARGGTQGIATGASTVNLSTQQNTENMYDQLLKAYQNVPGMLKGGTIAGGLGSAAAATQFSTEAEAYEKLRNSLAFALAKQDMGASANVSGDVIENYKQGIPSFDTSGPTAYMLFANLYDRLAGKHGALTNQPLKTAMESTGGAGGNNIASLPTFNTAANLSGSQSPISAMAAEPGATTQAASPFDQKIMVRNKQTNQIGTISLRYFSDAKYERL